MKNKGRGEGVHRANIINWKFPILHALLKIKRSWSIVTECYVYEYIHEGTQEEMASLLAHEPSNG